MKKLFLTGLILLGWLGFIIAQTQTTIEQNFQPEEDCKFAVFMLNGNVNINYWAGPTIKVTATVTTPEIGKKTLDELINEGRYFIDYNFHEEERVMIIDMPKQEKEFLINGYNLEEYLEFEINVPQGIRYKIITNRIPIVL